MLKIFKRKARGTRRVIYSVAVIFFCLLLVFKPVACFFLL